MLPAQHRNSSNSDQKAGTSTSRSNSTRKGLEKNRISRASRACGECRNRKIKCDVQEKGEACSRCQLHGMLCIVLRDKRVKKQQLPKAQPSLEADEQDYSFGDGNVQKSDCTSSSEESDDLENAEETMRFDAAFDHHWSALVDIGSKYVELDASTYDINHLGPREISNESIPRYIKTRHDMNPDDVRYLRSEGALTLPDTHFKNALLLGYIDHVHPSLPLINLHDFLAAACTSRIDKSGEGKISLLLFQAVMFAGSAYVDEMSLQMAGYATRREARAALYQKVKLLYDFHYEADDRLAVIQSLLLMTYWHEAQSDGKDEWHWLGVAISVTTSFHTRAEIVELNVRDQKVWNRVWWCCLTRDRLLALGLRRAPRIEEDFRDSFTAPTISLDDFEIRKLDVSNLTIPLSRSCVVQDTSLQIKLAKTFIAKAELCVCIGHILKTQYYPQVRDHGASLEPNTSSLPREVLLPQANADGFEACRKELEQWLLSVPKGMLHTTLTADRLAGDGNALFIEQAVLHMIYLVTLSTLHRPRALSTIPASSLQENDSQTVSHRTIREASLETTRIHRELYNLNLTRYLPTTAVTILLPAIVSHIQSIKSSSIHGPVWNEAMNGLTQCMKILHELRDNYYPADEAIHYLGGALRLANIQLVIEEPAGNPSPTNFECRRAMEYVEVLDSPQSFVDPQNIRHIHASPHISFPPDPDPDPMLWDDASATETANTSGNDHQAIDPAVSMLSRELAWLDDPSLMESWHNF